MQGESKRDKMLTVRNGWVACPICKNFRLMRITSATEGHEIPIYCRRCRNEILIDVHEGMSWESQSQ